MISKEPIDRKGSKECVTKTLLFMLTEIKTKICFNSDDAHSTNQPCKNEYQH